MPLSENIKQARNECGEGCVTAGGDGWHACLQGLSVLLATRLINRSHPFPVMLWLYQYAFFLWLHFKIFCVTVPHAPRVCCIYLGRVYVRRVWIGAVPLRDRSVYTGWLALWWHGRLCGRLWWTRLPWVTAGVTYTVSVPVHINIMPLSTNTATGSNPSLCVLPTAQVTCDNSHFQCLSDGECIPDVWVCDDEEDCEDGSDERQQCRKCIFNREANRLDNKSFPLSHTVITLWSVPSWKDVYQWSVQLQQWSLRPGRIPVRPRGRLLGWLWREILP